MNMACQMCGHVIFFHPNSYNGFLAVNPILVCSIYKPCTNNYVFSCCRRPDSGGVKMCYTGDLGHLGDAGKQTFLASSGSWLVIRKRLEAKAQWELRTGRKDRIQKIKVLKNQTRSIKIFVLRGNLCIFGILCISVRKFWPSRAPHN